jgi:hypothetical protein
MKTPWSRGDFGAGQYCSRPQRINVLLTNEDTGGFKIRTNVLKNADITLLAGTGRMKGAANQGGFIFRLDALFGRAGRNG